MRDKELRLALVCYGGISLAVYMHGITKEIWKAALASRAYRDHAAPATSSERIYHQLLQEIEATASIRLRVLTDIIAGASAGGINGVFLAQAIATGQSLDPLTDMWLDMADVEALLDPDQAPSHRFTKLWALPIAWLAIGRDDVIEQTVEAPARAEVRAKLEHFVRSRWFEPPFGGKRMLNMTIDALQAMAKGPVGPRLLPYGQPLDLFVTVTDFTGHAETLKLNSPPEVQETEHRLVVSFADQGMGGEKPLGDIAELAFAARATSSFPGAFPPFTVQELDRVLSERAMPWPGRATFLAHALPRRTEEGTAEQAQLVDGSVLVNAPFQPAIEALRERPARRHIDRRFIYIDPAPGARLDLYGQATDKPGFFQILIGSLSELPREQPIRDNLEAIGARSDRIERMRTIVEAIRAEVEAQVVTLFGYTLFLDYPTPKRIQAWRARAQVQAANKAGYGHAAYGMLKVDGVIDRLALLIATIAEQRTPERERQLRGTITRAIAERGANNFGATANSGATPATIDFLRSHDLGFRIRRLRLLARRVTELDAEHEREELTPMREAIYESLAAYLECERQEHFAPLKELARAVEQDAGPMLDAIAERMDLKALDTETDARLSDGMSKLSREMRRPVLLAYLGFPFFDVATLPLLEGEGLDEFDPIRVDRISPDDATAIRSGVHATLKGIQFNSFGAFFSRAYRENDYLWGRLHGADRMIDIIVSTLSPANRLSAERVAEIKRAAFHAILDEEEPRLSRIPALFAELRREIG